MSAGWLHLSGHRVKNSVTVIRDRVECLRSDGELLKEDYKGIIIFWGSLPTGSSFGSFMG